MTTSIDPKTVNSATELLGILITITKFGPTATAQHLQIDLGSLRTQIAERYRNLMQCSRTVADRTCKLQWTNWSAIDPEYVPPKYLMDELNCLLTAVAIGSSLFLNYSEEIQLPENVKTLEEFVCDALDTCNTLCAKEVPLAHNLHRLVHITSLSNSFNLSVLAIVNALLGNDKRGNVQLNCCNNLCGLVKLPIPERGIAVAPKRVKRHGQVLSQSELAEMSKSSISSISKVLRKLEGVMEDCRIASALDAAENSGIDTSEFVAVPHPPDTSTEWYTLAEAEKFLETDISTLPVILQPPVVMHDNVAWYRESDLEKLSEHLEKVNASSRAIVNLYA